LAATLLRYAQEASYCERILAKSGLTVLTATLARGPAPTYWAHYPDGDVYDFESGAHWYYHSHAEGDGDEHGHFHCFVRPYGKEGPIHHLVAISVDAMGRALRLFTVARHVVDDVELPAEARIGLLARFDVQLDFPNYLVNRWLTAMVGLYQEEIASLIREGAQQATRDPARDVTAQLGISLEAKRRSLGA